MEIEIREDPDLKLNEGKKENSLSEPEKAISRFNHNVRYRLIFLGDLPTGGFALMAILLVYLTQILGDFAKKRLKIKEVIMIKASNIFKQVIILSISLIQAIGASVLGNVLQTK